MARKKIDSMSYEEAFKEMEEIVGQLEDGELPLKESLDLYERGQALGLHCSTLLEKAELKLKQLSPDKDGNLIESDFVPDEE